MKNPILIVFAAFLFFSNLSCLKGKNCNPRSPSSEATQIQDYAANNGIVVTAHASGLYYQIIDPGAGTSPTINSKVVITYTGKLLTGLIFDQRTTPNNTATTGTESPWALAGLIEGWRVGLPLIGEGGHIRLLVPSAMAYGCTDFGVIPPDSILDFDINLVDVQ